MVRCQGSTGHYTPESGPTMLRVSFVVFDPRRKPAVNKSALSIPRRIKGEAGSFAQLGSSTSKLLGPPAKRRYD